MKAIRLILAAAALTFLCTAPVYAAEPASGTLPDGTDIPVHASYVDNTGLTPIPLDQSGSGSITLPNGTDVTVSGADVAGGRLVVEEVSEQAVLDWAATVLGDTAGDTKIYHIYQLGAGGTSQPTNGVTVTLKPKDTPADSVYALGSDKNLLPSTAENGTICFTTTGTDLYALHKAAGSSKKFPVWIIPTATGGCAAAAAAPFAVKFIKKKIRSKE